MHGRMMSVVVLGKKDKKGACCPALPPKWKQSKADVNYQITIGEKYNAIREIQSKAKGTS